MTLTLSLVPAEIGIGTCQRSATVSPGQACEALTDALPSTSYVLREIASLHWNITDSHSSTAHCSQKEHGEEPSHALLYRLNSASRPVPRGRTHRHGQSANVRPFRIWRRRHEGYRFCCTYRGRRNWRSRLRVGVQSLGFGTPTCLPEPLSRSAWESQRQLAPAFRRPRRRWRQRMVPWHNLPEPANRGQSNAVKLAGSAPSEAAIQSAVAAFVCAGADSRLSRSSLARKPLK
jgi:hypothetical protein